jgi:hypothetical protein
MLTAMVVPPVAPVGTSAPPSVPESSLLHAATNSAKLATKAMIAVLRIAPSPFGI